MSETNAHELPQDVDLDLDAYERPANEVIKPFTVRLGGRTIEFTNPDDLDWKDLLDIEDPIDFLHYCVTDEDRKHILAQDVPGHKFAKLMQTYQDHYQLAEKLDSARRQQRRRV